MEERSLIVKTENGKDIKIEVLDILDLDYNGIVKQYIVYKLENREELLISILNEQEESYSIETIESVEEYNYVQNKILNTIEGEENE